METVKAISLSRKTAVVLFNLGGPDGPDSVQPFLFNLFNDPAIIGLPNPFRRMLAAFISRRRAPKAQAIYEEIGGKSPILENTEAQAKALEQTLRAHGQVRVFSCMRYWHPMSDAVARAVKDYAPDHIILLPLYPQFSTTTTGSSLKDWARAAEMAGLKNTPTSQVCCYPMHDEFVKAHAQLIATYYAEAARYGTPRILFSAHGLPEKIIRRGDPYQWQVEQTTQAVLRELQAVLGENDRINLHPSRSLGSSPLEGEPPERSERGDLKNNTEPNCARITLPQTQACERNLVGGSDGEVKANVGICGTTPPTKSAGNTESNNKQCTKADLAPPQGGSCRASIAGGASSQNALDYVNCYQSRVGPMQWIGPSTESELLRAGFEKKPVVLVPIAFVSEHSETLVELDIEYAELAHSNGINHYYRVPTLSTHAHFIAALADICLKQTTQGGLAPDTGTRICGREWGGCLCKA